MSQKLFRVVVGCGSFAMLSQVQAAVINVPGNQPTIQAAINAAVSGVDEVVVAPGTYEETIQIAKDITVRSSGGANVTTIGFPGNVAPDGTFSHDVGSIVTVSISNPVLNGFSITGGTGTELYFPGSDVFGGGGMYSVYSGATVLNCRFTGNTTQGFGNGGGIYNGFSNSIVTNCVFRGNNASGDGGGGMYNDESSPMVTNCSFIDNSARTGGGMNNFIGSSPTVTNCSFSGNQASGGGGGMFNLDGSPMLTNCSFSANTSQGHGGGLFMWGDSPSVMGCSFIGNTANGDGGGMENRGANATVTDCNFIANQAAGDGGGGGMNLQEDSIVTNCRFIGNWAAFDGGGMRIHIASRPMVTNCTFSGNTVTARGGGIHVTDDSYPTLTNCSFSGNTAPDDSGGGISHYDSYSTIVNCILWGDTVPEIRNFYSSPVVSYSAVQGSLGAGTVNGGGNAFSDPVFVDADGPDDIPGTEDDDLRLQSGSPCMNTGDPAFVPDPGATDLGGHSRVLCGQVDMGAYESGIGDYDCDEVVNLDDFDSWNDCMSGPDGGPYDPGCESFDFEFDGDVDVSDFAEFQKVFTQ